MDPNGEEQGQGQLDDIQSYLTTFNKGIAGSDEAQGTAEQSELYNIALTGATQTTVNGSTVTEAESQGVMVNIQTTQVAEKGQDLLQNPQVLLQSQPGQVHIQPVVDAGAQGAMTTQTQSVIISSQADMSQIAGIGGQQIMLDSSQQGITVIDPTQGLALAQQGIAQPQIIQQQIIQQPGGLGPATLVFQPVVAQGMAPGQDIAQVAAAVSQTMPVVQDSQMAQQVTSHMSGGILEAAAIQTLAAAQATPVAGTEQTAEPEVDTPQEQPAEDGEPEEEAVETKTEQIEAKKEKSDDEVVPKQQDESDENTDGAEKQTELVQGQVENLPATQGEQDFQTVTLVPSDGNQGGEVSYVLIVSQNEEGQSKGDDTKMDMSVYDFQEEVRAAEGEENLDDDDEGAVEQKAKIVKVQPKKTSIQSGGQLMCNYCNYTSTKRYLLTRHMKSHSEERPHKCNICDRAFKTIASLQNHINTHTGTRPHKCKECDAAFTTSGELVRHVRYRHTFEKPHKCPECDYASVELSKLKRHIRSHTGERPYQCPHCSYASPDTYKLKRHLRVHTGEKPYECEVCHARFTQSNSLKAHRLIHSGDKPQYQCELCPTTCGRKTDLKIHIQKLHTSERPLPCKKCGKSFPDRYTYKLHMKTHDGEKCFRCELCPYAALSQRHLESHILTHTGEKPFQCDECDQAFRQKQLLKRHKNLYHTPDYVPPAPKDKAYECAECQKVFAHKGNLLRHMAMHDPDHKLTKEMLEASETQEVVITDNTDQNTILVTGPVDETPTSSKTTGGRVEIPVQTVQLVQVVDESGQNTTQILLQMEEGPQHVIDSSSLATETFDDDDDILPKKEEIETPRKRGRPPKHAKKLIVEPEPEDEEDSEEEDDDEPLIKQTAPPPAPKTPGRGRGRPRKSAAPAPEVMVEEDIPQEEPSTPPRATGHKRSTSEPEPGVETPKKRGRGRPPKSAQKAKQSQADDTSKDIEECFGFDDE